MFLRVYYTIVCVLFSCLLKLNAENPQTCIYKEEIDKNNHFPVISYDCRRRNFETVLDKAELQADINHLDLSFNNIKSLKPHSFGSNHLRKLDLSNNEIKEVDGRFFTDLQYLHVLDLSYNNISSIENSGEFDGLKKLNKLILSYNSIKTLPTGCFSYFKHLNYLDISYNPIGGYLMKSHKILTDELGLSKNLTHLLMDHTGITQLHNSYFDEYKNLTYLSLADNHFENIPTVPYSVEYLDLSGNNFTFISTHYLNYHSLKVLKLNRLKNLVDIHHYAFYNLPSLEKLYLSNCPQLTEFNSLVFGILAKNHDLVHPKYLNLARNSLTGLNSSFQYIFDKMEHVDLRYNHWNCDCDLLWLQEFKSNLYGIDNIRCSSPRRLINKQLLNLVEADSPTCFPATYGKKSHRILLIVLMLVIILLVGLIAFLMKYPYLNIRPSAHSQSPVPSPNSPYSRQLQAEGE